MNVCPDFHRFNSLFRLDVETGKLYNRTNRHWRAQKDKEAGGINLQGYLWIALDGKRYYVHRIIWLLIYGFWPTKVIDHINSNRADNRPSNLRDIKREINSYAKLEPEWFVRELPNPMAFEVHPPIPVITQKRKMPNRGRWLGSKSW